jgi:hypothetical protein
MDPLVDSRKATNSSGDSFRGSTSLIPASAMIAARHSSLSTDE